MVDVFVIVSMLTEVDIPSPSICHYNCARTHMLLDQSDQGVVVTVIVFTFNQEAVVTTSFRPAENPLSFNPFSPVVLPPSDE